MMATSQPASPLFLAPPSEIDAIMAWGEAEYFGDICAPRPFRRSAGLPRLLFFILAQLFAGPRE